MGLSPATRPRWIASLFLAAATAVLGWILLASDTLAPASYDSLHRLAGSQSQVLADSPVVIVYLDLNSFGLLQQDPARPWSRRLHTQLLRRLSAAGAKAVVFDIVFSGAGPEAAADKEFAAAIRGSGRVVLAGEVSGKNSHATGGFTDWARASTIAPPFDYFATNAAGWGVASHMIDDDYVVRRYLAGGFGADQLPSLTWAVARRLALPGAQDSAAITRANQQGLRYYGPPLAVPHVSYAEALAADGAPEGFFRDKIVFIGARPITGMFQERQDEFRSPFHSWGNKELFMPGVEVHATEMLNLLRNDWLHRLSGWREFLLVLAVALGFGGGLVWLRPIPAAFVALAGAGVCLGVTTAGFARGVWFPWLIISAAQIPAALGGSVLCYSVEWYRARKRFEAAKRIAEAKIREQAALIDKAHDAILVQDLNGAIRYANPSAEKLYGRKLPGLQSPTAAAEIFFPDAALAETARATALRDGEWNGELRQQTASGQLVTVASRWTLIRDEAGQPMQLLLINSDVTERKLLEQQFLRTQRMNTIGTLAGGMAHDLNNALAPILLGSQLLRRKATDDESRNLLSLMETNTQRGADMVRQVLLFARGRGGELERLELGALIKELEKLVRETFTRSITVEKYVATDLWSVRGNLTQLYQVLLNLCVNARDAMPNGGKLTFTADNVEMSAAEAAGIPDGAPGRFVSLVVSDTGTGMPPEVRAKIFEPFFTTKGEGSGTGMGLATVLRIVKGHGGFLRVESEQGEGTSFEIFVPSAPTVEPAVQPALTELPRGQGEMILLADDEQAIRDLVAAELTAYGYRVLTATNGAEAVALFREHQHEVRLFITDSSMPVLAGAAAIAMVRAVRSDLPVILTSGEADAEAAKPHAAAVVNKPFALQELLTAIQRGLRA